MALQSIRDKYKQILQQPESECDSEQQWQLVSSKVQNPKSIGFNNSKPNILSDHTKNTAADFSKINNQQNVQSKTSDHIILKTKEKLAQTLANLSKKEKQLYQSNQNNIRLTNQNKTLKKQVQQLKNTISEYQSQLIDQKVAYGVLQKQLQDTQKLCQQQSIDRDLMLNQVSFYQKEVETFKSKLECQKKQLEYINKDVIKIERLRQQNQRLRNDVRRLHRLLQQNQRFKRLPKIIDNCHYLGKAQKQPDRWFSQDLIGQTQHFLKKWQVGGKQQFTTSLIKYIDSQVKRAVKDAEGKLKKMQDSRRKTIQRKHNQSLCMHSITPNNLMGKSQPLSNSNFIPQTLKGSRIQRFGESKKVTQSFEMDRLCVSRGSHQSYQIKRSFTELLQEFKCALLHLLSEQKLRKKKIVRLIEWVCESGLQLINYEHSNTRKNIKILQ